MDREKIIKRAETDTHEKQRRRAEAILRAKRERELGRKIEVTEAERVRNEEATADYNARIAEAFNQQLIKIQEALAKLERKDADNGEPTDEAAIACNEEIDAIETAYRSEIASAQAAYAEAIKAPA